MLQALSGFDSVLGLGEEGGDRSLVADMRTPNARHVQRGPSSTVQAQGEAWRPYHDKDIDSIRYA